MKKNRKKEKIVDKVMNFLLAFFLLGTFVAATTADSPSLLASVCLMSFFSFGLYEVNSLYEWREEQKRIRRQRILERKAGL